MAGRFPPGNLFAFLHAVENENDAFVEYDGEEEEDEDSASEYEEDDGDEEYTGDVEPEAVVPPPAAPRVSPSRPATLSEDREVSPRTRGGGETTTSLSQDSEWSRSEIEGLFCPICMEAWTNGGDHQVCCLPCGHLFGASCIKKWLQQRKNSGKCPQCNRKSTLKDVRVLYAQQIVAIDQEIQKKVRSLEAKCASLQEKNNDWQKREGEWRKREADLNLEVHQLRESKSYLEHLLGDAQNRPSGLLDACEGFTEQAMIGRNLDLEFCGQESSSSFILQKELQIDGAKLFDVDASSQIGIIAQRLSGMGGMHVLSKMSLIAPHGRENIALPFNTKAVRDLRVAPHGKLALIASLGKKLSVISMESNNTVLSYDLPAAAWSCSWDLNSSHYVYAGLQNGMLLLFDTRQTLKPVESVGGLTCNPIHTMYSLSPDSTLPSGVRSLVTASSGGLYQWNFGAREERTCLIPGSDNQGVCIALAYCPSSSHIVASFRPKVEMSNDMVVSQPSLSSVSSPTGKGLRGTHTLYKALGNRCYQNLGSTCVDVPEVRLPKSAIICDRNLQFASSNEATCGVVLHKLPSFMVAQYLKSRVHPIRDVKYTHDLGSGLLSCLSEDRMQLFSRKTL